MSFASVLGLILCNVFWSAGYSITKNLMTSLKPMEIAFLRYGTAAAALLFYCSFKKARSGHSLLVDWARNIEPVDARLFLVGLLTFFVSPYLQMSGLSRTRAIDSSLMISMEPLFTIVSACLLLGERLRPVQIIAILIAMTGAGVLSDLTWTKLRTFSDARLVGNLLMCASMFSEAAYSIVSKPALERRSPLVFVTISLTAGVVLLFLYNVWESGIGRMAGIVPLLQSHDPIAFASILFLGLGCTMYGYLYWMVVLMSVPVSIMALTLYVQPVLGTVWGHLLLGESVTSSTFIGGALILGALWLGSQPRRG